MVGPSDDSASNPGMFISNLLIIANGHGGVTYQTRFRLNDTSDLAGFLGSIGTLPKTYARSARDSRLTFYCNAACWKATALSPSLGRRWVGNTPPAALIWASNSICCAKTPGSPAPSDQPALSR